MKNTMIIRRILWLCTAVVFLILILNSFNSMRTVYPTFNYRIPSDYNIQIGSVRFQDAINQFAEQFDQHVITIGYNLKSNARIAFITYVVSFLLSLIGFLIEFKDQKVTHTG